MVAAWEKPFVPAEGSREDQLANPEDKLPHEVYPIDAFLEDEFQRSPEDTFSPQSKFPSTHLQDISPDDNSPDNF